MSVSAIRNLKNACRVTPMRFASRSIATQQIHRKIYVHALDLATRARGGCEIKVCAEVFPRVVHLVEALGAQCLRLRGTALLRLRARGEPR